MRLKTYRAHTIADALAQVKKDFGRDAVILHTRSFKIGSWFGFGGKPVVEITASDTVNVVPRAGSSRAAVKESTPRREANVDNSGAPSQNRAAEPAASSAALRAYGAAPTKAATPTIHQPHRVSRLRQDSSRAADDTSLPAQQVDKAQACAAQTAAAPANRLATIEASASHAGLDEEIAAIKKMVGQVLQTTRHAALRASPQTVGASGPLPDPLVQHYLQLIESEVAADLADEIIGKVRAELSTDELADSTIVHQTVLRSLASLVPADAEIPKPGRTSDGRPLTIALIGPTGVGKTTTVAKLAAAYKIRHGKRVGLVTSDTYRIAAVEQLRTYAEIIGLPLKVAMSPQEMAAVCESLHDCDVILIDTAGRSQRDSGRLDELRQFIEAAKPHQTHLVLSSTASESVLVEAAQRFGQVNPDRIIFTKVDEAVNFGVLVTVAHKVALKLSYITTGQEVPDHIEVGRPERIAKLLLDGREAK